jgi:type II secretory pathway component GspD/PulD (secretin)
LEIDQYIEAFVGTSPSLGVPTPKSSRTLKTVVTVPNGRIIILGGLCSRREVETVEKIPLLGDIPILGFFFQSRTRIVSKTNLYIFIQPRILSHAQFDDLEEVSKEILQKIQRLKEEGLEGKPEDGKMKIDPSKLEQLDLNSMRPKQEEKK